jgi:CheY-like chemotaxis protein
MRNSSAVVRILVVDDFEPFRRFLCETLQGRPDLQIIGEASDGLQAVEKAEELRPVLILLDIGLPKLKWDRSGPSNIGTGPKLYNPLHRSEQRHGCGSCRFKQRSQRIYSKAECEPRTVACG